MKAARSTVLLLAVAACGASLASAADTPPSFHFEFPPLGLLRTTPDPGVLVNQHSLAQIDIAFNQQVQETADGRFSVDCAGKDGPLEASVRSPLAWVNGATVSIIPAAGFFEGAGLCKVAVEAGAYVSAANGSPSPAVSWEFTAGKFVAPGHSVEPPAVPTRQGTVVPLIEQLSADNVNATMTYLSTTWDNRFFNDASGEAAAAWLRSEYARMIAAAGRADDVEVVRFPHRWQMPSTIVRFKGSSPAVADERVVVGAHLDSINRQNYSVNARTGHAPGANDDASAIALQLEVARVLLAGGVTFSRTVELHAYAGEEEGLYGSADVSASYAVQNYTVAAMLQLDQCSYVSNPDKPVIAVYTDNTDPALSRFVAALATNYTSTPVVWSNEDHRADSDFHSFSGHGYRSAYAAEDVIDALVYGNSKHTPFDVMSGVSIAHAIEFGRIAMGFLVELASH